MDRFDRACGDRSGTFDDSGYVMALTAMLILPILAFTALAVDVGTWFARAAKIQRASDLAALSGVVWLPDTVKANTAATNTLAANGFTTGNSTITIQQVAGRNDQLEVKVTQAAPLSFGKLFTNNVNLNRAATAEYNKPVPLGSPSNSFGNNITGFIEAGQPGAPGCIDPKAACASTQPNLWAAIQGPFEAFENGDPYAPKCSGGDTTISTCNVAANTNGAQNALYRKSGYLWGIDVPPAAVGQTITVQIFDATHQAGCPTAPADNGGNSFLNESLPNCTSGGVANQGGQMNLGYELFDSDGSDLTISISPSLSMAANGSGGTGLNKCTGGTPGYRTITAAQNRDYSNGGIVDTMHNKWSTLCTFVPTKSGIHPLQVKSSDVKVAGGASTMTDTGGGWNVYAVRATGAAGLRSYALNDMSIWNTSNGTAKFYLAEIPSVHAGKKLILDLYDPGDGSGASAFTMQFRTPPGCNGPCPSTVPGSLSGTTSCNYNATASSTFGPLTPNTSANCQITSKNAGASSGIYNSKWLRVQIQIPTTYTCNADCWWTVTYNFGTSTVNDRTVWAINVVGDPVHLVG